MFKRVLSTYIILACLAAAHAPYVGAQCYVEWQTPRLLRTADGRPAYVESPTAVATKAGVLLLGTPAFLWAEKNAFDPVPASNRPSDSAAYFDRVRADHGFIGFVLSAAGTASPVRPPTSVPAQRIRRLVAIAGPNNTTHAVWYSPTHKSADPDSADGDVWYAELHEGRWSVPKLVFSDSRLDWSGANASLLVGSHSDVHIVLAFSRGIAYIRRIEGRWRTTKTPLQGLPSQATAQFVGTDSLVVAYARIGAAGVRVRNGQHVYVIRAAITDSTWPPSKLVHYSGLGQVWQLALHGSTAAKSRAITLVWIAIHPGSASISDTLYAMASTHRGLDWRAPTRLGLPFKIAHFAQANVSRGDVEVVLSTTSRSRQPTEEDIFRTAVEGGQWTALQAVSAQKVESALSLSAIRERTLLLTWGVTRPAESRPQESLAPITSYVISSRNCSNPTHPNNNLPYP